MTTKNKLVKYNLWGDNMKMSLVEKDNRPREKMIKKGAFSLTDSELLAIMLGSGTKDESILDLSTRVLSEYSLKTLFNLNYKDLIKIKGIKEAKATKLLATFEIARRAMEDKTKGVILNSAEDVFNYVKYEYSLLTEEVLTVIYVSSSLQVIGKEKFTSRTVSSVEVPYRDVLNSALNKNATGIFLVHNHPGGDISPSRADLHVVDELSDILKPLNMHLFDSIIISDNKYFSIAESIEPSNPLNELQFHFK